MLSGCCCCHLPKGVYTCEISSTVDHPRRRPGVAQDEVSSSISSSSTLSRAAEPPGIPHHHLNQCRRGRDCQLPRTPSWTRSPHGSMERVSSTETNLYFLLIFQQIKLIGLKSFLSRCTITQNTAQIGSPKIVAKISSEGLL